MYGSGVAVVRQKGAKGKKCIIDKKKREADKEPWRSQEQKELWT